VKIRYRLAAVISAVAVIVLAAGMAAIPAQAAISLNLWGSNTGAYYPMNALAEQNSTVLTEPTGSFWTSLGCESLDGYTYCHQELVLYSSGTYDDTGFCMSAYDVPEGSILEMQSCKQLGGGAQVDQLWRFTGGNLLGTKAGVLENYGTGLYAVGNGQLLSGVYLDPYSGAKNNFWYYVPE
jgi:hypothetical protein